MRLPHLHTLPRRDMTRNSTPFSSPIHLVLPSLLLSFFLSFFILSNINTISQIRFHEPTDSRACYSRRRPTKSPHHVPGQQPIHFPLGNNSWQVHYYKCRIYYRVPGLLLHSDFVCSAIVRLFLPVSLSLLFLYIKTSYSDLFLLSRPLFVLVVEYGIGF